MIKIRLDIKQRKGCVEVFPIYVKQKYVDHEFYNGTYKVFEDGTIEASKSECNSMIYRRFETEKDALDWCINMEYEII